MSTSQAVARHTALPDAHTLARIGGREREAPEPSVREHDLRAPDRERPAPVRRALPARRQLYVLHLVRRSRPTGYDR
jgi:hypothetical protein